MSAQADSTRLATSTLAELGQLWDVDQIIDLSTTYAAGMANLLPRYPPFELKELPPERDQDGRPYSYTQQVRMCVQTGTYLETGAHMYPDMESIAEIDLHRLFVSAVVISVPKAARERVTAKDINNALTQAQEQLNPGDALLVRTGYNCFRSGDVHAERTPHFSYDAIEWTVAQKISILGSDMANWYDGDEQPNFWPMLMRSGVLIVPLLENLEFIDVPRIKLIALPMKIQGACAAPCRVVAIVPPSARSRLAR